MKYFLSLIFCGAMITATLTSAAQAKKTTTQKAVTSKKTVVASRNNKKVSTVRIKAAVDTSIRIKIWTDSGTMIVKLYDSTPLHRDNFAKLVKQGFYDSLIFHRVIAGFMIQGGDPTSKNAAPDVMLGNGGSDMTRIPAEFRSTLFHKKGVLAAARDNNPEKASSACQFYLVQGKAYSDQDLNNIELSIGHKFSAEQRLAYKTIGGTPFLDQNYTVFGEVISGMDVIDKIARSQTNGANRPLKDIRMKMEPVK